MSDPRADSLRSLAELTSAMLHGRDGFEHRLGEMGCGYPSAGEGSPGNAASGGPTSALAMTHIPGGRTDAKGRALPVAVDVAELERKAWERDLRKALEHAGAMWARYQRIVNVRMGVERLTDPGCELCAKIPCGGSLCDKPKGASSYRCETVDAHWCPVYATVEIRDESRRKGQPDTVRKAVLCSSCFEFQRPNRAGRLPTHDEVLDHVQGRRRRWKAS